jgi:hypothetical protein
VDPRAYFEQKLAPKLGPLIGFEAVAGMRPKTGKEIIANQERFDQETCPSCIAPGPVQPTRADRADPHQKNAMKCFFAVEVA